MPQHSVIVRTYANCVITVSRSCDGLGALCAHVLDARTHMHMPAINAANSEQALEQAMAFVDALPEEGRTWAPPLPVRI